MLKTALVAMTIVGCDCDAKQCEFVSDTPARWASVTECESAINFHILQSPGIDYPLVTGICRTVSVPDEKGTSAPATALASLKQETAHSLYDSVREKGGNVWQRSADGYRLVKAGLTWTADHITPSVLALWVPSRD